MNKNIIRVTVVLTTLLAGGYLLYTYQPPLSPPETDELSLVGSNKKLSVGTFSSAKEMEEYYWDAHSRGWFEDPVLPSSNRFGDSWGPPPADSPTESLYKTQLSKNPKKGTKKTNRTEQITNADGVFDVKIRSAKFLYYEPGCPVTLHQKKLKCSDIYRTDITTDINLYVLVDITNTDDQSLNSKTVMVDSRTSRSIVTNDAVYIATTVVNSEAALSRDFYFSNFVDQLPSDYVKKMRKAYDHPDLDMATKRAKEAMVNYTKNLKAQESDNLEALGKRVFQKYLTTKNTEIENTVLYKISFDPDIPITATIVPGMILSDDDVYVTAEGLSIKTTLGARSRDTSHIPNVFEEKIYIISEDLKVTPQ